VLLRLSGKLKTVGELLGEKMVSSDFLGETHALFAHILPIPSSDFDNHQSSLSKKKKKKKNFVIVPCCTLR
jgi:hypothetical protein